MAAAKPSSQESRSGKGGQSAFLSGAVSGVFTRHERARAGELACHQLHLRLTRRPSATARCCSRSMSSRLDSRRRLRRAGRLGASAASSSLQCHTQAEFHV